MHIDYLIPNMFMAEILKTHHDKVLPNVMDNKPGNDILETSSFNNFEIAMRKVDTGEVRQIITKKPQGGRSTMVNRLVSRSPDHRTVSLIRVDDTRPVHLTLEHFQHAKAYLIRCLMIIAHNRVFSLYWTEPHPSSPDVFVFIRNFSLCPRLHHISTFHSFTHTSPQREKCSVAELSIVHSCLCVSWPLAR